MDRQLHAIRIAARRLLRNKTYSIVIVLCLALGIGANAAIFSVINTLLLRPLPVKDVDEVVFTLEMRTEDDPFEACLIDAISFKNDGDSFASVGLGRYNAFRLLGRERPEQVRGADISSDYLTTLGIEPVLGRSFGPDDDRPGAPRVILISHSFWKTHFDGASDVVGQSLNLDNTPCEIIGVLPLGFDLPLGTKIWMPLRMDIESVPLRSKVADRDYFLVARLKPVVSLVQANTEATVIAHRLEEEYPQFRKGWGIKLIPLRQQLIGDITGSIRPTLFILLAIVGFLLLITCANVASLFLARSVERSHETAIQVALGASRGRLVSNLLTESILLSLIGGAVGLLFARFATSSLMALNPVSFNALKDVFQNVQIDWRVLSFTFAVSVVTGAIFALAPAIRTAIPGGLINQLKEGGRQTGGVGGRRLFDALVVGGIAVATILLFGAGLMVKSFQKLSDARLGFRPDHLLAVEMPLTESDYPDHVKRAEFANRLLERVRGLPGVASAGTTTNIPLSVSSWDSFYTVEQAPVDEVETPVTAHRMVSPQYLETIGVSLVRGRLIEEQDHAGSLPVVVISKEFANRAWPGEDPIGKRLKKGHPPRPDAPWYTVVGVVDDVREDRFNFKIDRPVWYIPYSQFENDIPLWLVVRASSDPAILMPAVRDAVASVNNNQPVSETTVMESHVSEVLGPERFAALLSTLFAALGLALAAVGIYGVTAYSILQRRREFSIRMAFGARWADLVRMVLGRGMGLAGAGLVIGTAGGLLLGRILTSLLYEVKPGAPEMFIIPVGVLLVAVLIAICLPVLRLARFDPLEGLRYE